MNNTKSLAHLIGSNIRRERLRQDLSQEQLSGNVGKTTQYLSLLENGNRLGSINTYSAIATKLGIPISKLFQASIEGANDSNNEQGVLDFLNDCSLYELYILKATLYAIREAYALCGLAALNPESTGN